MIRFFRTLRRSLLNEGKTLAYLKYAIGEIALIVVGILIALQVNDWNERRRDAADADYFRQRLVEELRLEEQQIQGVVDSAARSEEAAGRAAGMVRANGVDARTRAQFASDLRLTVSYPIYDSQVGALAELQQTGRMAIFKDREVREKLTTYLASMQSLETATQQGFEVFLGFNQVLGAQLDVGEHFGEVLSPDAEINGNRALARALTSHRVLKGGMVRIFQRRLQDAQALRAFLEAGGQGQPGPQQPEHEPDEETST